MPTWRDIVVAASHPAARSKARTREDIGIQDDWTEVGSRKKRKQHSRREDRPNTAGDRSAFKTSKPVPRWLLGRCFKFLWLGHRKLDCGGERRCYNCWFTGHVERECPDRSRSDPTTRPPPRPATTPRVASQPSATQPASPTRPSRKKVVPARAKMTRCGDPSFRPSGVRVCAIPWTAGMHEQEAYLGSHALLASVRGNRQAISPEMLVAVLSRDCGVRRQEVRVEVCAPDDFLITFANPDDCHRTVMYFSGNLWVQGCRIDFCRWNKRAAAGSSEMKYLVKLGLEGLPAHAWEEVAVRILLAGWRCHLVELLPPADARSLEVVAWAAQPNLIPKEPPSPPRKNCLDYNLIVHVLEVTDPSPEPYGLEAYYDLIRRDDDDDEERRRANRAATSSSAFREGLMAQDRIGLAWGVANPSEAHRPGLRAAFSVGRSIACRRLCLHIGGRAMTTAPNVKNPRSSLSSKLGYTYHGPMRRRRRKGPQALGQAQAADLLHEGATIGLGRESGLQPPQQVGGEEAHKAEKMNPAQLEGVEGHKGGETASAFENLPPHMSMQISSFIDACTMTTAPSVLGTPPPPMRPETRKRFTVPDGFKPRRSPRILLQGDGARKHTITKAQTVAMKKLGIIGEQDQPSQAALGKFVNLFNNPLSASNLEALAELLGVEMETKLSQVDVCSVRQTCGPAFSDFVFLAAQGTRGGIILAWKSDVFAATLVHSGAWSISVRIKELITAREWFLTTVYGPQDEQEKLMFLDELHTAAGICQPAWAIAGDFNLVTSVADKSNGRVNRRLMNAFKNKLNQLELKEVYLFGRRYTWSNEQQQPILAKLDRVFVTASWEELFSEMSLQALSSSVSDHCPILLACGSYLHKPRKFRFENFWIKLDGFGQMARLSRKLRSWGQRRISQLRLQFQVASEIILRGLSVRCHTRKKPTILLKLDISRAFDSVSWQFLINMLRFRGFGPRWCTWVCTLLATSSATVCMNGFECDPIIPAKGLRQGDPLSPMLFVMVMDSLQALVRRATQHRLLSRIEGVASAISLYADDAVIFFRPTELEAYGLKAILDLFGSATGLWVNFTKSAITTIQCSQKEAELVQNILQCRVEAFPITYLGLPLSLRKLTKPDIQPLLDRFGKKIAGWKPKFLSTGDRLILIKSILFALPLHLPSVLEMPKWALKEINRKCRGFLWKRQEEIHGGHCLVAWKLICMPVENGGLGIKDLDLFGKALRLKWLALQHDQKDRPWAKFPIRQPKQMENMSYLATKFIVGNGTTVNFWKAHWLPGGSIMNSRKCLFSHVEKSNLTVADGVHNNRWVRDIKGAPSNVAIAEYFAVWDEVQQMMLNPEQEDAVMWKTATNGCFSVAEAYKFFFAANTLVVCGKINWKSHVPTKIKFFMWLAERGRCLTADNLAQRGWPHQAGCRLCSAAQESCAHLFVDCRFTNEVWTRLRSWVELDFTLPGERGLALGDWWLEARSCCRTVYRKNFDALVQLTF
uniref:CCHC-type domain-containing protein n=1 Tax=Oryza brachyantha TaxID=4533 RepID=J3NA39_ORYBR